MKFNFAMLPDSLEENRVVPLERVPELHLKKILVATDFSECSRKAFHYAVSLGKQYHAEVLLLHVFEPVPPEVKILEASLMDTSFQEDATRQLEEWQSQLKAEVEVRGVLRKGTPAHKRIAAAAHELEADLIVIGNHGRNAVGRALMGRTAEKVVRSAPCPVLVIREREHDFLAEEGEPTGLP